ncbi:MAG: DJ-1/PfpI family protein [Gammaproteobacteria bacterium]|nr:DJ-1/PfpI family protein [Gammaproteobacteria bacterium]MCW8987475.1 DJ-1/PfpI family protein [Gammaproteobacteria bacterium]MCW9031271.1 DJ-1/PfpI family protein [Gammaproteobacteria bacterium]
MEKASTTIAHTPVVLVPLAQGCEELEAITITDLLTRAGINVVTAGLDGNVVTASRGMKLIPDKLLDDVLDIDFDMIVLPGGLPGADHLNSDSRIQTIVKKLAANNKYTAAICAAPRVLATAGILDGKHATSFPGALDQFPVKNITYEESAVVVDGKVITSRGPGTAMDFSLTLIELMLGEAKRNEVELALQRVKN